MIDDTTAILLAGGLSSRFGSNKLLYQFKNGEFLYQKGFKKLRSIFKEVIINSNSYELKDDIEILEDKIKNIGPIGGLYSSLECVKTDSVFILAADMPNIDKDTILNIIYYKKFGYRVIIYKVEGIVNPLVGYYHKDIIPYIDKNIKKGEYSLKKLINSIDKNLVKIINLKQDKVGIFRNINRVEDLF